MALNKARNKGHYDTLLRSTSLDRILDKVRDADTFLADATRTDTSWVSLYDGAFRHRLRGARVLELGSGDGLNSLIMAASGAEVVSVDISDVASELLARAACEANLSSRIRALSGDFAQIPLPARSFDFVVGKAFLHHLTHDLEDEYLRKSASALRPTGEARFVEPAVNSALLDAMRWIVPVPGRPSALNAAAFRRYQAEDPHPPRDNASTHYRAVSARYFESVRIVPFGALERFHRVLPDGALSRSFRRTAFRAERVLPPWIRLKLARTQLLVLRQPRTNEVRSA